MSSVENRRKLVPIILWSPEQDLVASRDAHGNSKDVWPFNHINVKNNIYTQFVLLGHSTPLETSCPSCSDAHSLLGPM